MPLLADPRGAARDDRPARRAGPSRASRTSSSAPRRAASSSAPRSPAGSAAASSPARKPGKLPLADGQRDVRARVRLRTRSSCTPTRSRTGQRVLVHDDVLATGGTAKAIGELVEQLGGEVVGVCRSSSSSTFLDGPRAARGLRRLLADHVLSDAQRCPSGLPISKSRRMYDALTTPVHVRVPGAGRDARARSRRSGALERLPGAAHPAVFRVAFDCPCGDEHPGLVPHDELDWAPLGLPAGALPQPDDRAARARSTTSSRDARRAADRGGRVALELLLLPGGAPAAGLPVVVLPARSGRARRGGRARRPLPRLRKRLGQPRLARSTSTCRSTTTARSASSSTSSPTTPSGRSRSSAPSSTRRSFDSRRLDLH